MNWKELGRVTGRVTAVAGMIVTAGCDVSTPERRGPITDSSAPVVALEGLLNNPSNFVGRKVLIQGFAHGEVPSNAPASFFGITCDGNQRLASTGLTVEDRFTINQGKMLHIVYCVDKDYKFAGSDAKSEPVWFRGVLMEVSGSSSRYVFRANDVR